jgi:hypothetical protein
VNSKASLGILKLKKIFYQPNLHYCSINLCEGKKQNPLPEKEQKATNLIFLLLLQGKDTTSDSL